MTVMYSRYGGSMKGNHVFRVRKGWFARRAEHPEVLRAWRVGGRLTCVSALAFHQGAQPGPVLHVEVPANAVRLRDPDDESVRLSRGASVVVHWSRRPGPGDRRSVTAEHAEATAAACGVHAGPVSRRATRATTQAAEAASSVSASRMV